MAGEVNASISGLDFLNEALAQTLPMLDRLIEDNRATVAQTMQKIERALDDNTAWANSAYQRYQGALTELNWAIRDECVSEYHYSAVYSAEAEYNRLIQTCSRIKAIYSEYSSRTEAYKRSLSDDFNDYSTLLTKSKSFLSRYAELLRRSQKALGGEAGNGNYQEPSTLRKVVAAGASGLREEPLPWAQVGGAVFAPPNADDAYAQALQVTANVGIAVVEGLTEGMIRQFGKSPDAVLSELKIQQAIADGVKASGRTEPLAEPLRDDQEIIDGETGENLTDEKLRK